MGNVIPTDEIPTVRFQFPTVQRLAVKFSEQKLPFPTDVKIPIDQYKFEFPTVVTCRFLLIKIPLLECFFESHRWEILECENAVSYGRNSSGIWVKFPVKQGCK